MQLDLDALVWPGRHQPVLAARGMVATSQPLATRAGLDVLREGGNAVDAAIAMAATLTVVEPATSSIGGDSFVLVWDGDRLHGLNGSGRAPHALTADRIRAAGHDSMPEHGWLPVTVPGTPAAWADLHSRFGSVPFDRLLASAVDYARNGHPVSPISRWHWHWEVEQVHSSLEGNAFAGFMALWAPTGHAPKVGEIWSSGEMADTLALLAETGAHAFYQGEVAERIIEFSAATGGLLSEDDLAHHASTWVDPISTRYRGYDVWEIPPNGQGLAALMALDILEGFDLSKWPRNSVEGIHHQIEAMKLAFADVQRFVADPNFEDVPVARLLAKDYASRRRRLIGTMASSPTSGSPAASDTAYLCTADSDGMMVSYIQSTYDGFGAHVVVPGTGVVLQNRGSCFTLDPDHPNVVEPGKRPFHTIIPGFLSKDGRAVGPFGVMGGHMQPQGHVQMVVNTIDYAMDPQTSLDQPRWFWWKERATRHEPAAGILVDELRRRGHEALVWNELDAYGRGQIIWQLPSGAYIAGSDHRGDGQASGF